MRFLVTGVTGQLGRDVVRELESRGYNDILAYSSAQMDITDQKKVESCIFYSEPDVVIHCAAYTAVDKAEDDLKRCNDVNAIGTKNLVEQCKRVGAKFIYVSTDYVFDGTKDLSQTYEVTDHENPIGAYGKTKLLGEYYTKKYEKHFIVRTSWVFGENGNNFVKTMLRLGQTRDEVSVVSDQYGSPTYTVDLAKLLVDMSLTEKYGTYHANNEGYCSWAEFAEKIFEVNGLDVKVNHITTEEYPTRAERPKNSKLSKKALVDNGFDLLPHYEDALVRYKEELEIKEQNNKKLEMKKPEVE